MSRKLVVLALVATGLALLAAFDAILAAPPAFGLSALAAWLVVS